MSSFGILVIIMSIEQSFVLVEYGKVVVQRREIYQHFHPGINCIVRCFAGLGMLIGCRVVQEFVRFCYSQFS